MSHEVVYRGPGVVLHPADAGLFPASSHATSGARPSQPRVVEESHHPFASSSTLGRPPRHTQTGSRVGGSCVGAFLSAPVRLLRQLVEPSSEKREGNTYSHASTRQVLRMHGDAVLSYAALFVGLVLSLLLLSWVLPVNSDTKAFPASSAGRVTFLDETTGTFPFTLEDRSRVFLHRPNWRRADDSSPPWKEASADRAAARWVTWEREHKVARDGSPMWEEPLESFTFSAAAKGRRRAGGERGQPEANAFQGARGAEDRVRTGALNQRVNHAFVETGGGLADDTDVVRVFLVAFTTRMDDFVCSLAASAYLSGLPIVILGFKHEFHNFTDKHFEVQKALARADMRPHDVVVCLDSDVLLSSGEDLVQSIDRFIRFSPEGPEELDARAVRDDNSRALAPLIFTAEHKCSYLDLFGPLLSLECEPRFMAFGARAFDEYMMDAFPGRGDYQPMVNYTFRFLNAGALIARVWAYEAFMRAFAEFPKHTVALRNAKQQVTGGWECDQSIAGALYLALLKHEAAVDIYGVRRTQGTESLWWSVRRSRARRHGHGHIFPGLTDHMKHPEKALKELQTVMRGVESRVNLFSSSVPNRDTSPNMKGDAALSSPPHKQVGPLGLLPGLIALDVHSQFFTVITNRLTTYVKLNDRYWRAGAEAKSELRGASDADSVGLKLSGGATGGSGGGGVRQRLQRRAEEVRRIFSLSAAPKRLWASVMSPKKAHSDDAEGAGDLNMRAHRSALEDHPPGRFKLRIGRHYFEPRTTAYDGLDDEDTFSKQSGKAAEGNAHAAPGQEEVQQRPQQGLLPSGNDLFDPRLSEKDEKEVTAGSVHQASHAGTHGFVSAILERPLDPTVALCVVDGLMQASLQSQRHAKMPEGHSSRVRAGFASRKAPLAASPRWGDDLDEDPMELPIGVNGAVTAVGANATAMEAWLSPGFRFFDYIERTCVRCRASDWLVQRSKRLPLALSAYSIAEEAPPGDDLAHERMHEDGEDTQVKGLRPDFFYTQRIPSRTPGVPDLVLTKAPPLMSVNLFPSSVVSPLQSASLRTQERVFPAVLHFTGRGKPEQRFVFMSIASWMSPLMFSPLSPAATEREREHTRRSTVVDERPLPSQEGRPGRASSVDPGPASVRAFLQGMLLELWGDSFREVRHFGRVCGPYIESWFADADKRQYAGKDAWPFEVY